MDEIRGFEPAPIDFEIAEPGPKERGLQVYSPLGAEVGPGQNATWDVATADHTDAVGFSFDSAGRSSKHFPFDWSRPGD